MEVIIIEENEFDEKVLKEKGRVLVDFYADWCGPCRMLSPIVEEVAEKIDNMKFYKINVDHAEAISRKYGIMSIPALMIFEGGEVVKNSVGLMSKDELKEFVEI